MTGAAIVLAGGQSRRMGVPKATLLLDGKTLLRHAVDACANFSPIVVVGPPELASLLTDVPGCILTREEPPGGGPSVGLAAGLAALEENRAETVQVLCCDLPRAGGLVAALDGHDWAGCEALVPVDSQCWPQYLSARYRLAALRAAIPAESEARDQGVRRLLSGLHAKLVPLEEELVADVDDPQAASRAGVTLQS
ncbi:molybdenum cofactor guanylyltransferase [Luteococcus sp. H138]|uniref:molybdenum cofactor guanylyltransferase n=1 Tax=unclassified Luteococcus TaxID=2639923 RepID=UPI00313B428A